MKVFLTSSSTQKAVSVPAVRTETLLPSTSSQYLAGSSQSSAPSCAPKALSHETAESEVDWRLKPLTMLSSSSSSCEIAVVCLLQHGPLRPSSRLLSTLGAEVGEVLCGRARPRSRLHFMSGGMLAGALGRNPSGERTGIGCGSGFSASCATGCACCQYGCATKVVPICISCVACWQGSDTIAATTGSACPGTKCGGHVAASGTVMNGGCCWCSLCRNRGCCLGCCGCCDSCSCCLSDWCGPCCRWCF